MIFLETLLSVFFGVALFLTLYMAIYLFVKGKWQAKYASWNNMIDLLLRRAIFFHENGNATGKLIPVGPRLKANLENQRFRSQFTTQLIAAKKNISGQAGQNLRQLYLQLHLDDYALQLIASGRWHLMAKGIQQIGTMEVQEHLTKVYRYTNHKHELVRAEAQLAVLSLSGFEGLRFLDVISYQLSEWQQIKLLKELSLVSHVRLTGIDKWLKSENPSVVAFALKLVRNYHHFELYEDIVDCLQHPEPYVRLQAIYALTDVFSEGTSSALLDRFDQDEYDNQLAILKALKKIGDDADLPRLQAYLSISDDEIKLAVARAMANISENGLVLLLNDPQAKRYPLNEMIQQIKSEIRI